MEWAIVMIQNTNRIDYLVMAWHGQESPMRNGKLRWKGSCLAHSQLERNIQANSKTVQGRSNLSKRLEGKISTSTSPSQFSFLKNKTKGEGETISLQGKTQKLVSYIEKREPKRIDYDLWDFKEKRSINILKHLWFIDRVKSQMAKLLIWSISTWTENEKGNYWGC